MQATTIETTNNINWHHCPPWQPIGDYSCNWDTHVTCAVWPANPTNKTYYGYIIHNGKQVFSGTFSCETDQEARERMEKLAPTYTK